VFSTPPEPLAVEGIFAAGGIPLLFATRMAIYHFRLFDLHDRYVRGHFAHCDGDADALACANDLLTLTGVTCIEILKDGRLVYETRRTFGGGA
jgi:hypothetical protein